MQALQLPAACNATFSLISTKGEPPIGDRSVHMVD
jgi:hypothetical protein